MLDFFKNHKLTKLGGLNNQNYLLEYYNNSYVLRIPNKENTEDFKKENLILSLVDSYKLSPPIIYHNIKNGTLLTKYEDNSILDYKTYTSRKFIDLLVPKLKKLHSLNCSFTFDPFMKIRENIVLLEKKDFNFKYDINLFIKKLDSLEIELKKDIELGFCHCDLNSSNILFRDNNILLIDFEYSGMCDIFYDLATISWFYSTSLKKYLLSTYFDSYNDKYIEKLDSYLYVVKLLNCTWSYLKSFENADYDYKKGGNLILEELYRNIYVDLTYR